MGDVLDLSPDFIPDSFCPPAEPYSTGQCLFWNGANLKNFHSELWIPNPAAYEGSVVHQRLHKAVTGTAQRTVIVRFLYSSGGIGSCVDKDDFGVTLYEERQRAGQYAGYNGVQLSLLIYFNIGTNKREKAAASGRASISFGCMERKYSRIFSITSSLASPSIK